MSPTSNRGTLSDSRPAGAPGRDHCLDERDQVGVVALRQRLVGVLEVVLRPAVELGQVVRAQQPLDPPVVLHRVDPVLVVRREQVNRRVHLLDAVAELVDAEEPGPEAHGEHGEGRLLPVGQEEGLAVRDHHAAEAVGPA